MAFSGTELEEVAPTTVGTTCAGGGKVFAIGSGETAIMDDATSEAYLYSSPGDNAFHVQRQVYYATASSAYSSATSKAWYGTIGTFCSITAAGITGSVSSGTSVGYSGSRYLYCHKIATTGDYVWGEWVQPWYASKYCWARLTISTSSVWASAISTGSSYPAGVAIGVGGYMYAAVNWALTARRWSLFQVRAI